MANKENEKLFLLIDANSLFHRAYHALPRFKTKSGELTNAVYGFSSILIKALQDFEPQYIAAAFDVAGPTFRDEEYEDYKATRTKAPDELYAQIPRIKEVLSAFNIPVYEREGFEADDVIGTVSAIIEKEHKGIKTMIVSGDLDTLQLASEHTNIYTMKKGVKETVIYDEPAVKKRFGVKPEDLADYKGLRGDSSDNIPGVPGVGEKTASKLLKKYKNLEKLYKALEEEKVDIVSERIQGVLLENKEQAMFSRMLATIRRDVDIDFNLKDAEWGGFEQEEVEELFVELNFRRLIERLGRLEGFEAKEEGQEGGGSGISPREKELLDNIEDARDAGVLSDEIYQLEKNLVPVIVSMEERGIKIDKSILQDLEKDLQKQLEAIEKKIHKKAGEEFNINSPAQLSEVLFNKLGISTKGLKRTPGKKVSTAASELEKLSGKHDIIDLILEQRELQKILSTYVSPLPELADEKGRIHTTFKPLGTATGRMSSKEPNLQNIPMRGDFAQKIRSSFVAEKGKLFLACDYSQMELRVVAHLSQDKNMIDTFKKGEDIHVNTAALVFGTEKDKVTKQMRYRAKALNFGIIYGIGPKAFARSADISFEEAREFIQKYFDVFEDVAAYMEETKQKANQLGYVETMFGRKRFLPDLTSPNPMLRSYAERAAINHPVQGTSADIVKMAMVKAFKELKGVDLLLQIHDELLWEGENDTIKKTAPRAKKLLEEVVELSVPLEVDHKTGPSWGELKL